MQKEKGVSTLDGIAIILAVALVTFGGVFAYQYFAAKTQPAIQTQQNQNIENKASIIEGISVEKPNLVVKGQNLSKVQIYFVPTGTGIDPETMSRIENAIKQSENNGEQIWTYRYPSDLLITNIFAKGFDNNGNFVREVDLPIVGATALADALYGNTTDQTAGWKTYTNTQYGFEFKYPSNMEVEEENNNIVISKIAIPKGFSYRVYIFEKDNNQSLLDFYNSNRDIIRKTEGEGILKESKITQRNINNYDGLEVYFSYMEAEREKFFIKNNNSNLIVDFVFNVIDSSLSSEQQSVLNSFKFTK